jgi:hypothetical protein
MTDKRTLRRLVFWSLYVALAWFVLGIAALYNSDAVTFAQPATAVQSEPYNIDEQGMSMNAVAGIVLVLGGALISVVVWNFTQMRAAIGTLHSAIDDLSEKHHKEMLAIMRQIGHISGRVAHIEGRLGLETPAFGDNDNT